MKVMINIRAEVNVIKIGKKQYSGKKFLFTDDVVVYIENSKLSKNS